MGEGLIGAEREAEDAMGDARLVEAGAAARRSASQREGALKVEMYVHLGAVAHGAMHLKSRRAPPGRLPEAPRSWRG